MSKGSKIAKPRVPKKTSSESDKVVDAAIGSTGNAVKVSEVAQAARATAIVEKNLSLSGIPELIAKDKFKFIKHEWAGARQAFPHNKSNWYVDIYFPYADGGPLFIDQVKNEVHKTSLKDKFNAMRKLGHRYLQLDSTMDVTAALEQLA